MSALDGLRVLELSDSIAAAYAGKLLRDHGADVVKVERSDGGDPLRRWSAATPDAPTDGTGALFAFLHGGKTSVTGGSFEHELPKWADVIIGNASDTVATRTHRRTDTSAIASESFASDGPLAGTAAT